MTEEVHDCCKHGDHEKKKPWFQSFLFLTAAVSALLMGAAVLFEPFHPLKHVFNEYFGMMFWPIMLGFVIGGIIEYYIPQEYISRHLASHETKTVFYATGLGFLMSTCSHGILALSMALHRKGASGPAVVSFLLSSPWANFPITILLVGFFGWRGILIILSALVVAVTTGMILQALDRKGWIEKNRHYVKTDLSFSIRKDIQVRWKNYRFSFKQTAEDLTGVCKGMISLANMVLPWILVGIILASLSSVFVPHATFHRFFGPSFTGLLMTIFLATVLEVCSEGTSPLAFEIYKQTGAFGNAFAFLMGGVVTDYTEIGMLWKNVGPKTALWTLAVSLPQIFFIAILFNRWLSA